MVAHLADLEYLKEGLNESPSEKEGKSVSITTATSPLTGLNESPSEKEGK